MGGVIRPEDVVNGRLCPEIVKKVDPVALLPYLPCIAPCRKETITCEQQNKGRGIAVQALLQYMRGRDNWFAQFTTALRHPDIGLESLAIQLDKEISGKRKKTARGPIRARQSTVVTEHSLIRELRSASLRKAFQRLSLHGLQTWEDFADRVGYSMDDIGMFKSDADNSPASALLLDWMRHEDATLGRLVQVLYAMERHDILTALQQSDPRVDKIVSEKLKTLREGTIQSQDMVFLKAHFVSYGTQDNQKCEKTFGTSDSRSSLTETLETGENCADFFDLQQWASLSRESGTDRTLDQQDVAASPKGNCSGFRRPVESGTSKNQREILTEIAGLESREEVRSLTCPVSSASIHSDATEPTNYGTAIHSAKTAIFCDQAICMNERLQAISQAIGMNERPQAISQAIGMKERPQAISQAISMNDRPKGSFAGTMPGRNNAADINKILYSCRRVLAAAQQVYGTWS